jgi:urease accessory protein
MAERTTTPTRTDRPMLHAGLPATSATRVTRVAVERPTGFGAPVRVRTSDGLLAARLISRDGARAEVALVAGGAMLLGGDHVVVSVQVDSGCALTLTDVGGTVAYDGDGQACRWDADIRLGPGATLGWAGLPFVVAGGADVRRTTTARLGAGAGLTLRETVVLGRSGERGGRVLLRTDIADGVGPILVEELAAAGDRPVPGVLGDHPVIDTLTRVHGSPDACLHGGHDRPGTASGADEVLGLGDATTLRLERGGALTRWLGAATHLSPLEPPALAAPSPPNTSEDA